MITVSTLSQSRVTNKISIIMTELEDYRHEYLLLCMRNFYNDHKFAILNDWSEQ